MDRELVEEAARWLGLDPEAARSRDERPPAILEEIGMALGAGTPLTGAPLSAAGSPTGDQALADATRRVILSLADAGGHVILGRGAQAVLAGRPDACHLALVADLGERAGWVAASQGLRQKEALDMCRRVDGERAAYLRRFFGVDISDPLLYDCVLNTSRLGVDGAVPVAVEAVGQKLGMT